jgi:hypothetical protein
MGHKMIVAGIAFLAVAAPSSTALADSLTRSTCWTFDFKERGSTRTLCFSGSRKVTMRNRNLTATKEWSRCEWTGEYSQDNGKVRATFVQGSGKCSNGAASPQFTAVCDFNGELLVCEGSSVVDGKTYDFSGTFE